jgi:hypothetical protein
MYRFQEKLRELRKNPETSRAGFKWENDEDCSLVDKINEGVSIDDIAKEFLRTTGGIKTRVTSKAIEAIDEENLSIEDAASKFKIEVADIENYQKKKVEREQRKQVNSNRNRSERQDRPIRSNNTVITLSTIHALLQQISNKLG